MEIERKYLVKEVPELSSYEKKEIEQYYISVKPETRVRKSNDDYFLTIKSKGDLVRKEVEIKIDKFEFDELKEMAEGKCIIKTRYKIPYGDYICELDLYKNIDNLVTVEVEFSSKDEANAFIKPDWFGYEVTYDNSYKNASLAMHNYFKS